MKKLADFIVDKRYFILVLFLCLTGFCLFLSTKVTINYDITEYLPKNSETRLGMNLMNNQFEKEKSSNLLVMFHDITGHEEEILNELSEIKGVNSVEYDNTKQYNIDNYTLYNLHVDDYSDSKVSKVEKKYYVLIETSYGNMTVELYNETPQHRDNFLKLVNEGFYNDLLFHRVINGFMIQGGDPNSRDAKPGAPLGNGNLGYTVPAEFVKGLIHRKGALAAARQGDMVNPTKASSSCQFYIVQGNVWTNDMLQMMSQRMGKTFDQQQIDVYTTVGGTPHLDYDYTVFGQVVEGLDVIDKIAAVNCDPATNRPLEDVKMKISVLKR